MSTPSIPTPDRIMQLAWGYAPTLIIHTAVALKLFDLLDGPGLTLAEAAAQSRTSARGLKAILNALVGLELLAREGERYRLTPESAAYLVSTRPGYRGTFFDHHRHQLIPQWLQLEEVVRAGRPAETTNRQSNGAKYFADFVESLFPGSYPAAQALGRQLNVGAIERPFSVLDIGAGSGVWGIAIAEQSRQVRIHAVDFPEVLEVTRRIAARHGVGDRLTCAPGDFTQADFGSNHQLATLGHILHSEGPEANGALLKKTFDALAPGGVVAIQEFVPRDDRRGPAQPLIFAVNMLVNTESGDTYTFAEITEWLHEAGFSRMRQLAVPGPSPLILADKEAD